MTGSVKLNSAGGGSITLVTPSTASNVTATIPAATDTLVNLASSQTLSNKTISALVTTGTATMGGLLNLGSTGQIQFPATQVASSDANTLDDYEEGTWTPTGNGGIVLNGAYGWYTKIGNVVHVCAQWAYPTNSNSNSALVNGLPFVSNNASSNFAGGVPITSYGSDNLYVFVSAGTSQVFVRNNTNTDITNASLSNKFVQFMAIYIV